jgi:ABC-2 type transport system permease protein
MKERKTNSMLAIMQKEFTALFKSFKSLAVIFFFLIITFAISRSFHQNLSFLQQSGSDTSPYVSSIRGLLIFFGFLFGMTLSHDSINREIESQTIRYLVPKINRQSIIIGKFLGILFFWIVSITISFSVISIYAKKIYLIDYIQMIGYIGYVISLTILLSMVVRKSTYTMFIAVFLGILLPGLGLWTTFTPSHWGVVKYLFPFYYILDHSVKNMIPFVFSALFLIITISIFTRRDL